MRNHNVRLGVVLVLVAGLGGVLGEVSAKGKKAGADAAEAWDVSSPPGEWREVTAGAEQDEGVGAWRPGGAHEAPCFSSWPPNSLRMAESTRPANSPSPRDSKRS